jgi:hypothetical protein
MITGAIVRQVYYFPIFNKNQKISGSFFIALRKGYKKWQIQFQAMV